VPVDHASGQRPYRLQPADIGRRDLRERAVAPPVVRSTVHHPVAVVRTPQSRLGDRRVIAENSRHGRGPGRRLRREQRRWGVLGPQHGRRGESECERNGSDDPGHGGRMVPRSHSELDLRQVSRLPSTCRPDVECRGCSHCRRTR
jgi:hypothetical protein